MLDSGDFPRSDLTPEYWNGRWVSGTSPQPTYPEMRGSHFSPLLRPSKNINCSINHLPVEFIFRWFIGFFSQGHPRQRSNIFIPFLHCCLCSSLFLMSLTESNLLPQAERWCRLEPPVPSPFLSVMEPSFRPPLRHPTVWCLHGPMYLFVTAFFTMVH